MKKRYKKTVLMWRIQIPFTKNETLIWSFRGSLFTFDFTDTFVSISLL